MRQGRACMPYNRELHTTPPALHSRLDFWGWHVRALRWGRARGSTWVSRTAATLAKVAWLVRAESWITKAGIASSVKHTPPSPPIAHSHTTKSPLITCC